jgi:hypothetical protein
MRGLVFTTGIGYNGTMLVLEGFFKSGNFISSTPVTIPDDKRAIVTVLDEKPVENGKTASWREFFTALDGMEPLPAGDIPRANLDAGRSIVL